MFHRSLATSPSTVLAANFGVPRVFSGYYFNNNDQGPPHNADWTPTSPTFNSDSTCAGASGWTCEHRWPQIRRMVLFRAACTGAPTLAKVASDNAIAWARQGCGFFALNNDVNAWTSTFQTTLPAGIYCDLYTGDASANGCQGRTIAVHADGTVQLTIPPSQYIAFYKL